MELIQTQPLKIVKAVKVTKSKFDQLYVQNGMQLLKIAKGSSYTEGQVLTGDFTISQYAWDAFTTGEGADTQTVPAGRAWFLNDKVTALDVVNYTKAVQKEKAALTAALAEAGITVAEFEALVA